MEQSTDLKDFDFLIGHTIEKARELLKAYNNFRLRIVKQDGVSRVITMGYCIDRLNINVEEGIVSEIRLIG
jgi:hypothetical protein